MIVIHTTCENADFHQKLIPRHKNNIIALGEIFQLPEKGFYSIKIWDSSRTWLLNLGPTEISEPDAALIWRLPRAPCRWRCRPGLFPLACTHLTPKWWQYLQTLPLSSERQNHQRTRSVQVGDTFHLKYYAENIK